MTLQDLHRKVEEASGPSREIDRDLFVEFDPARALSAFNNGKTGMPVPRLPLNFGGLGGAAMMNSAPRYTASVDAALALVERMLPGWGCQVGRPIQTYTSGWYASVFRERLPGESDMFAGNFSDFDGDRGGRPRDSYRQNGAIAIILALLSALSTIQSGGSDA